MTKKRTLHDKVIIAITVVAGIVFLLSASALDSESWTPTIMCICSLAWLSAFTWANN